MRQRYCLPDQVSHKALKTWYFSSKHSQRSRLYIWYKTMKKYLDILIFTLLFFLLFSYFSGKQEQQEQKGVSFELSQKSYTIPAGVMINIQNSESEDLIFESCRDISVRFQGEVLEFPQDLCQEYRLETGEQAEINFSSYYTLFQETGTYTFEFELWEKKWLEQTEVRYRSTLGKIFVGLFYAPTYNLLVFFIQLFWNSLGWAIVAVTVVIRILLLYPQHKMMVSQRKMQAIQPKVKKLQEKYKWDQQAMGMELMKLYKKEWVNPLGSCGLLLIQMPILIVMYNIILHITSRQNEFYLYPLLGDFHTSQIEFHFFGIDLLVAGGLTGILLALGVWLIQYIQVKLSLSFHSANTPQSDWLVLEKKKNEQEYHSLMPDPEMMNKFMLYGMPAMVMVFTYTLIAGVWVYWGISTLFAIVQQIFVNKIVKR